MKTKQELEKEINEKNLQLLNSDQGIENLLIYNLENFAYRYIETQNNKDIKCQRDGVVFYVESVETDIYSALKWENSLVKNDLIELCKKYPGKKSKEIQVKLIIGSSLNSENEIECFAKINWDFPSFTSSTSEVSKVKKYQFQDLLELRNIHANLLEEVCEIF